MAKLILTHDVPNLGSAGDVVVVKDGYARNYLVPRRLAERWTAGAQKQIDAAVALHRKKAIESIEDARAVRDQLEAAKYTVAKRASATGNLYGALSSADVAAAVEATTGVKLDRRKVVIENAIKNTGSVVVFANLHPEVSARLNVNVVAE
ncbi:ribosomal protein L9 [Gleimia coleocanis DSM 15436]|uniref:Large ribosomal subunit protein bL9 n=1 Tax=Gleimia coleocanis DSM 15436 TaxID=525245 RepID=C0VXY2_9ACTO|nr:50S ribosomal protein L9 [Gleimia coleocanis]EEH64285.1 ribosomal protein L9 [Gleimia coleocanis DSM 15436]